MSTKEKLIARFKSHPKDFTFDDVVRLFSVLGFRLSNKGGTSGSQVAFIRGDDLFSMHKPHPSKVIPPGLLKRIHNYLLDSKLM